VAMAETGRFQSKPPSSAVDNVLKEVIK
jgi:hypothetical protein